LPAHVARCATSPPRSCSSLSLCHRIPAVSRLLQAPSDPASSAHARETQLAQVWGEGRQRARVQGVLLRRAQRDPLWGHLIERRQAILFPHIRLHGQPLSSEVHNV
jgi:hypothetical protein